ncbi:MAG: virulence protein SciE type [Gammaproteobacteria bacterium]|nr:MAG: virulence protein SciE type [Gammaproteobacteria bacterium]
MSAETLLQQGELNAALAALTQQVKAKPADASQRVFLFQMLVVLGQWDRAQTQLELAGQLDVSVMAMVQTYRDVINCELHRQAVFAGKSKPLIFGEPEEWVALLVEAQQCFARGDYAAFKTLNAQAFEQAETRSGKINDEPFTWLADADQRMGPVFEFIFNEHYYWVPMSRVRSLRTDEPEDLRDLVWQPAEVTWTNGGKLIVMLPSRYPRTEGVSETDLLARSTDWVAHAEDVFEGVGQRMLATDQQDYSFLQVRSIEFDE